MRYTKSGGATVAGPAAQFTGTVFIDGVRNPDEHSSIGCAHVRFASGARTAWHSHPRGQTLYVTDGIGLVASRGGGVRRSGPATWCTSSPMKSTGTGRQPIASCRTSRCRRLTRTAKWSPGWST